MSEERMGLLYISKGLYGEDMIRLQDGLRGAGFELNIDPLKDEADLVKLEDEETSEPDLILPDPDTEQVTVILAGLAAIQVQALAMGDIPKVEAAGESMGELAEANPEQIREAFLENNEAFRIMAMPDELLEHLDLEVRDGKLYENTDGEGWTEVELDE